MSPVIASLLFAQASAGSTEAPTLIVEEGPGIVFTCDGPDNNDAEIAICEADAAECADPQTQQAMNQCAMEDFQATDLELNLQWLDTVEVMRARDAGLEPGDEQPGHFDTLLATQRAWLVYREAECLSQSFMARGGSLQPLLNAQCKTYLTELRIEQLRVLAAGPE